MSVSLYCKQASRWILAILCLGVVLIGSGCSGINASKSFSPLDFFLPGLLDSRTNQPPGEPIVLSAKLSQS